MLTPGSVFQSLNRYPRGVGTNANIQLECSHEVHTLAKHELCNDRHSWTYTIMSINQKQFNTHTALLTVIENSSNLVVIL